MRLLHAGLALTALFTLGARRSTAQVTVVVQVSLPSPYLSDWEVKPFIASMAVTNGTGASVSATVTAELVQGRGTVVGQAPSDITDFPTTPSFYNSTQMARWTQMTLSGAVASAVQKTGRLPEGPYTVCMAFTNMTSAGRPIANARGCSPTFTIAFPQPPTLIAPANGSSVTTPYPAFQWTPVITPGGSPLAYHFKLVEVLPGQTPLQAFDANVPLFETVVASVTTLVYPPSALPLEAGKTYAWRVQSGQAGDGLEVSPVGANEGKSQVFAFKKTPLPVPIAVAPVAPAAPKPPPPAPGPAPAPGPGAKPPSYIGGAPLYNTMLGGKLAYTFYPGALPEPKRIKPFVALTWPAIQYTAGGGPVGGAGGAPPPISAGMQTIPPGGVSQKVLAGVNVRLVVRYRSGEAPVNSGSVTVGGKTHNDVGKVVATATTGTDGHFTFMFHDDVPTGQIGFMQSISWGGGDFKHSEAAGSLFRYYNLEVMDGHYLSPSDELTADTPGGDVGTLVSLVRSYTLRVRTMRLATTKLGNQEYTLPVEVLPNMRVQLLRVYRPAPIPKDEGTAPTPRAMVQIPGYLGIPTPAEVLADSTTGTDGAVTFRHLVKNVGVNDVYLVRAFTDTNTGGHYYYPAITSYKNSWGLSTNPPKPFDLAQFNEQYNTGLKDSIYIGMNPHPPRIAGKLERGDNALPVDSGFAIIARSGGPLILRAAPKGMFAADNLPPTPEPNRWAVTGGRAGFKPLKKMVEVALPYGEQWYSEFLLTPAARIKARFVDENGAPVHASIRVGDGPEILSWPLTYDKQGFGNYAYMAPTSYGVDTTATSGASQPMKVRADDFNDLDTTVTLQTGQNDFGTIHLLSKKRRVIVRVIRGPATGKLALPGSPPVAGAHVKTDVIGIEGVTGSDGTVLLAWKGGTTNATTVQVFITGPPNQEWVAMEATCEAKETPTPKTCTVYLRPATRVTGIVYAGAGSAAPVGGARVFAPDHPDVTTTADASGHYVLHAVPLDVKQLAAGKAASGLIADFHAVSLVTPQTEGVDFHLTHYEGIDITRLLGFPLEVHEIHVPPDSDGVIVSGALIAPQNAALSPEHAGATAATTQLDFENVRIRAAQGSAQAVPDGDSVPLIDATLDLRMYGSYKLLQSGALVVRPRSPGIGAVFGPIEVRRDQTFSATSQALSFQKPQGQDAPLFLLMPGAVGAARTVLPSLTADSASPAPPSGFNLGSPAGGGAQFKVNGGQGSQFDVDGDPSGSFARADGAHFKATLHTAIPDVGDLALSAPDLNLKPGSGVQASGSQDTVQVKLDQWTLRAFGWYILPAGVTFASGDINAQGIVFPYTGMTVLPTELVGGTLTSTAILIGGVVPLEPTGAVSFIREPGGPWKIWAAGGTIAGLPGFASGQALQVQNWALYSKGAPNFSPASSKVRLYNTADFTVGSIVPGQGIVSLAGSLDLVAPVEANLGPTGVTIYYQKTQGQLVASLTGASWSNVDMGGPKLTITNGQLGPGGFTAGGSIDVPGQFTVATTFTRTPITGSNKITVVPTPDAAIKIGDIAITQLKGGATLNSPWKTAFQGVLTSLGDELGGEMSFDVQGATVTVGTAGLKVKNIATPFGNVALVLNIPEKRLEGSVELNHTVSVGAQASGTLNLAISGKPGDKYWYFLGGVNFALQTPQLAATAAILIGNAQMKQPQIDAFNAYASKPLPADFYNISGFFVAGKASVGLIVVDCPNGEIDLGIAYVGAGCEIWADVRLGMNFNGDNVYRLGMGFGARAWAKGGVSLGVCISVSGEAKYYNEFQGAYRSDGAWYVEGTGAYTLTVGFEFGVGAFGVCLSDHESKSATLGVDAQIGNDWLQGDGPHFTIFWK